MDALLVQLLHLCEVDMEVHALREQLALYPKMLADFDRREAHANSEVEGCRKRFEKFHEQRKSAELEVASQREKITKYQAQQNLVKSNKEFEAITEEIASAEEKIDKLEFAGLEALEQEEAEQAASSKHDEALKEIQTEAATERERIAAQQGTKSEQLADREKEHGRLVTQLPEELREPYNLLNDKYPGTALASIDGGLCSGCSYTLVTQRMAEVKRGTVGIHCDNCTRILYDTAMLKPGEG